MKVEDLTPLITEVTNEVLGKEDLTEIKNVKDLVSVGEEIINNGKVDCYVKALVDRIGKTYYKDRRYAPELVSMFMSNWDYGSVIQSIGAEMPPVVKDDSYDLIDGHDYPFTTFTAPKVHVKYFDKSGSYQIKMSFPREQVNMSFTSFEELNKFIGLIRVQIENALAIAMQDMGKTCLSNMIANTIYADYKDNDNGTLGDLTAKSGVKAVNLLALYKKDHADTKLTPETCLKDTDFLKFASYTIKRYARDMSQASTLFNIDGRVKFTPKDNLDIKLLADFANATDCYLQSSTFHNELTALPTAEIVTTWQGSGKDFGFNSVSSINVTAIESESKDGSSVTHSVKASGILGVMYDHIALGCCGEKKTITTGYVPSGNFDNYFYKNLYSWFNDFSENFVVFMVA